MMMAGAMPPAAHIVTRPRLRSRRSSSSRIVPIRIEPVAPMGWPSDRAAVDVDLVAIELEVPDEFFGDHRKRLIDLEQIDIVERETGFRQHLARRRHRR